jgi:hypothetical protein
VRPPGFLVCSTQKLSSLLTAIERFTNPDEVQYDFMSEEIRIILLKNAPKSQAVRVFNKVSEYVAAQIGKSVKKFAAQLQNPYQQQEVKSFAEVSKGILRNLGGEYAQFAEKMELASQDNRQLLGEINQIQILTTYTEEPWSLPLDVLVLSTNNSASGGRLTESFLEFIGEDNGKILDKARIVAFETLHKKRITPDSPLPISLSTSIKELLNISDTSQPCFLFCATVENPEPTVESAVLATEAIIKLMVQYKLKQVVLPLLGTGINRLAKEEVAVAMITKIREVCSDLPPQTIESINIIDRDENTLEMMRRIFAELQSKSGAGTVNTYLYQIKVANRNSVQVNKLDEQRRSLGQLAGVLRYEEKRGDLEPLLEAQRNHENNGEKIKALGEMLFSILFDQGLQIDFLTFYNQARQEQEILRIELDIDEKNLPDIAALPWEFMRLPQGANLGTIWLGTAPDVSLTRVSLTRKRSQWLPAQPIQLVAEEKLRIGLVVSTPEGLGKVDSQTLEQSLQELAVNNPNLVEILPTTAGNPEAINELLEKRKPHILHFIAHGRVKDEDNQDVEQLALSDPTLNDPVWVDADYICGILEEYKPALVFLQACDSGALSANQPFFGIASRIVQQNVEVVIAMQYAVTNATANRFSRKFYEKILTGEPVDIAAQDARRFITLGETLYNKRDFATPVIFMRVEEGNLFVAQGNVEPVNPPATSSHPQPNVNSMNSTPLILWKKKLIFLRQQEALLSDAAQKFAIQHQIEEAKAKIKELESEDDINDNKTPVVNPPKRTPKLSGKEVAQLMQAIKDSFPEEELKLLLFESLDIYYESIKNGNTYEMIIFNLIRQYFESRGETGTFVQSLVKDRPNNQELRDFYTTHYQ